MPSKKNKMTFDLISNVNDAIYYCESIKQLGSYKLARNVYLLIEFMMGE